MQLKGKKICIIITILVYCATFFIQSNLLFFQTWAQEKNIPNVNLVAVLVDDKIYNSISSDVKRYASNYIQGKIPNSEAVVLPLDLETISSHDIYRMMENIYFDGLEKVNSSLVGLVMIGHIPLPVVNQNGYEFPTVYPYVDFEDQKYVWDETVQCFVPNGNLGGQAEIWHGLIDYGNDVQAYGNYFSKIKTYVNNPDDFIGDGFWYEDFVAEKEGFLEENYQYYKNKILFSEDIGYQRFSPLMRQIFANESLDNAVTLLNGVLGGLSGVDESVLLSIQNNDQGRTTKTNQQEIQDKYLADYEDLFSSVNLSTMRENILAGGRWIKQYKNQSGQQVQLANVDNSSSLIQLKDTLYLGNDNLEGLIQNWNDLFEEMIDKKIETENYDMDIVIPVSHEKITTKKVWFKKHDLLERWENYYFGKYALYIDDPKELSIYRGTYRNLDSLDGITFDSLNNGYNPTVSSEDKTDTKLKSVGASYDIFSTQVEGNRGFTMLKMNEDLDTYDEKKQAAKWFKNGWRRFWGTLGTRLGGVKEMKWSTECDDTENGKCETLSEFAQRWWGGASAMNLDTDSIAEGRYALSGYVARNSWRSIYDMGGFQSLLVGDDEGDSGEGWVDGKGVGPQTAALSFKSYLKYASPTKVNSWEKMGAGYIYYANKMSDEHESVSEENYWKLENISSSSFEKQSDNVFQVKHDKDTYVYKFLDSVIKHVSTTVDEINGIDYDKYGESGSLGRYYADISKGYFDVENSVYEAMLSGNQYVKNISSYKENLNTKKTQLQELVNDTIEDIEKIKQLNSEINSLEENSSSDDTDLSKKQAEIQSLNGNVKSKIGQINDVIYDISNISNNLKQDLLDMYGNITALSPDDINLVLNHIIYSEGGNPEEYEGNVSSNLKKIPMLSEWKEVIKNSKNNIESNYGKSVALYKQAIKDTTSYQGLWNDIEKMLNEIKDGGWNEIEDSDVNTMIKEIFKFEGGIEDENGNIAEKKTITLDEQSLNKAKEINGDGGNPVFEEYFKQINMVFDNLVENDDKGDQIIDLAKSNKDFIVRFLDEYDGNSLSDLSGADIITLFSSWTKGAGYGKIQDPEQLELIAGATEHLSGMNILTPDRPIDSPRYVSMQGIGGNEIKLIYPNLFKVEVFDVVELENTGINYESHKLKSIDDIFKSLEKYLTGKVEEYNTILNNEKSHALKSDIYFDSIKGFNPLATPTLDDGVRSYKEFTYDDFLNVVGGQSGLYVIAEILYYQNLTNVSKLSSNDVSQDIDYLKDSFDVNEKRGYVLQNYLKEKNDKNQLVIPTYELSGYEVAFVNSDGGDYIFPGKENEEILSSTDIEYLKRDFQSNMVPSSEENDLNEECGIPTDGTVLLFDIKTGKSPWLEAFKCWCEQTKKKPFELKLTFDNALGSAYVGSGLKGFIKSYGAAVGDELSGTYNSWKDEWKESFDSWDTVQEKEEDLYSTQGINQLSVDAEQRNQQSMQGAGYGSAIRTLNNNLKISNSISKLTDINSESVLEIASLADLGNISVSITSTGDSCLAVEGIAVCNGGSFSKSFNPAKETLKLKITTFDHVAGISALDMKFSIGGGILEKVVQYYISPSFIESIELSGGDVKSVAGIVTPFSAVAKDKYGNNVERSYEDFDFVVSQGRFLLNGSYMTGFTTKDFKNLNFKYQAPLDAVDGSDAIIQVRKSSDNSVKVTYPQPVIQGKMEVKLNNSVILKGDELSVDKSYRLTSDESIYSTDGKNIDVSKLQKLEISVRDLKGALINVDTQVLVSSKKGLVVVGQVERSNNESKFIKTSLGKLYDGKIEFYYYPTHVAGDDVISIEIPGLEPRNINLSILPGQYEKAYMELDRDLLYIDSSAEIDIRVTDHRGNPIDGDVPFSVNIYECEKNLIEFNPGKLDACEGTATMLHNGFGKVSIYGLKAGIANFVGGVNSKVATRLDVNVDGILFPTEELNVMYLNYFGNDWGNQWGYLSKNNKYIENLMNKSNKIITTTTQLISEDKIKQIVWKVQPGFKIINNDKIDTKLSIQNGNIGVKIGDIVEMKGKISSLEWSQEGTLNAVETKIVALDKSQSKQNYGFFIPSSNQYSLNGGVIYDGGTNIVKLIGGEVALVLSDSSLGNGYNIWNVNFKGINYGYVVLYCPNFKPSVSDFSNPLKRYIVDYSFTAGSTANLSSVAIFDAQSDFELGSSYKSIQNSNDVSERIGFLGDFKNVTLFAEGEIVGEATRKFGSEFVINLGDPLLSKKSENIKVYGSKFGGGIGREIYTDAANDIFGSYPIDFNNDGLQDLLVIYLDGTIKLSKNYGGENDLKNMQELMRIAVGIEEAYVGDVDGNKYDDIIIRTSNNQIRTYLNNGGIFDVDGNLVCLNVGVVAGVTDTPSNISSIYQLFVEDMNLDGIVDVITNDDKGKVKVFYGGSTKGYANYLSTEKYACDTGRYSRQENNTITVTSLGLNVSSDPIYDNSMMHWDGLHNPELDIKEEDLEDFGITINQNLYTDEKIGLLIEPSKGNKGKSDMSKAIDGIVDEFNVDKSSTKFIEDYARYHEVTLYNSENEPVNYTFIPISYLDIATYGDPVSVYKTYATSNNSVLFDGDKVTVTVYIKANRAINGTFGDIIQGPWRIYYDNYNIFKGIKFISPQGSAKIKSKDGDFAYLIDDIHLSAGQTFIFQYTLEYASTQIRDIDITYETFYSDDKYPDIKVKCMDGCTKDFDAYINGGRSFSKETIELQKMIDDYYNQVENDTNDYKTDLDNLGENINALPGLIGDRLDRISLLKGGDIEISNDEAGKSNLMDLVKSKIVDSIAGGEGSINFNMDLNLFEEQTNQIESIIDDITKGMCNGFEFGGSNTCKGLPVPFNQAFLAPGKYHLFGCRDLPLGKLEGGLPVFFFPGTVNIMGAPIPIPYGMKGPGDSFIWVPGGEYPSMIRIYAAPTLTAQLGLAICLGPYGIGAKIPSPLSDIGGNCIVIAVKPQCKNDDGGVKQDPENPNETFEIWEEEVRDSGICNQTQKGIQVLEYGKNSSPLMLEEYSVAGKFSGYKWSSANPQNMGYDYSVNILGGINMEIDSVVGADEDSVAMKNSITIAGVDVLGGDFTVNKIRGGLQQGIRKLLVDKWLDPQIRYIANQLTKMSVVVKLPDFSNYYQNEIETINNAVNSMDEVFSSSVNDFNNHGDDFLDDFDSFVDSYKNVKSELDNNRNDFVSDWNDSKWYEKGKSVSSFIGNEGSNLSTLDWSMISNQYLNQFNKNLANPFEALANLMNQSNIININTETLVVKVPMILAEDIDAYEIYLKQWLKVNGEILEEWSEFLSAFNAKCSTLEGGEQSQCYSEAQANMAAFVEIQGPNWQKTLDQINRNIIILQEYRNFPFEIYEWIHVIDRYMSEIASLINDTIGYLSYWLQINSGRFVGYVDAITLIMNIIKTYQLIIDFSVNRSEKCGNCAEDTYDQYSCKLSMLCDSIELPIIQIPNFKIPNITIDLSNIDIGLDIILPEFNFQPVRVDLPDLPNIPEPSNLSVNIKLPEFPNIPILPEPPELPDLPSFITEVDFELPILPPAPELPKIPTEIEGIINVADLIGKIYCIVKGKFGLVGEKSVKAKIEQLTQRTYEVPWIDNIMDFTNLSVVPVKNYGVDYEISSHVDFQFDFENIYNYLDFLTSKINDLSTNIVNNGINEGLNVISDKMQEVVDSATISNVDVNLDLSWNPEISKNQNDLEGLTSDEVEYTDYNSAKTRLQEVLTYFRNESSKGGFKDKYDKSIQKIENQINKSSVITPNQKGLYDIQDSVQKYLDSYSSGYDNIGNLIENNYEGFLAMVETHYNKSGFNDSYQNDEKQLVFNVNLFNLDSSTKETLKNISKENPYQELLSNKKNIVDGYRNAINNSTSESLGLSSLQYLVLRTNIENIKKNVDGLYAVTKPVQSLNLIAKNSNDVNGKTLVASNSVDLGLSSETTIAVDPAGYAKGIYDTILDTVTGEERKTKIVNSATFVDLIGNNYYFTNRVIGKGLKNIILWNENAVYLKTENDILKGGGNGNYYIASTLKSIPYEEKWISLGNNSKLKIADENIEVKNWKIDGQTFDNLSFSWSNDRAENVDGYLIKMVDRIDYSYEKADYTKNYVLPRYILVLPNSVDKGMLEDEIFKLEILNKTDSIKKLIEGGEVAEVVYYDTHKSTIDITISDVDRKWWYGRIVTLKNEGGIYNINSPWSNQIVAGRQIVGDDQGPMANLDGLANLYRDSTSEIVSEGENLEGFVGTWYTLNVTWEDNVALSYVNLSKNGQILLEEYTSEPSITLSRPGLFHIKQESENFKTIAIDQFGNKSEKTITISYKIPDIAISNIERDENNKDLTIVTAELSQDIDTGNVTFQGKRGESRRNLMSVDKIIDFELMPKLNAVRGKFSAGNDIALYGKDGETVLALMDPDTGELNVQDAFKDSVNVVVRVNDSAIINIIDKSTSKNFFEISLPMQNLLKIEAGDLYSVVDLPEDGNMGMYNGGKIVSSEGNVVLLISPTGHLYSDLGLEGYYEYDREVQSIKFVLYQMNDVEKQNPISVRLKVQPYVS